MGADIPVYFEGEQDGVFNDSDYFDFYGTRNYGGLTNTYRDSSGINVVHYTTEEYYSSYSDTNIYWVGWDGNFGLRYLLFTSSSQSNYPSAFHYATEHFEIDSVYSLGETVNPNIDFRYFNTEKVSGEGWYWKNMQNGSTVSRVCASPNLFSPSQTCSFRIFASPNSRDTVFNEHKLVLRINSTPIATLSRNDNSLFDTSVTFPGSLLSSTGNNTVSVTYTPTFGNLNAFPSLYFDLIEIKYTARSGEAPSAARPGLL